MAQELPAQKETLETIVKVNDYFMKKYADYTLPSFYGRVRPSNIWTRGVYYSDRTDTYYKGRYKLVRSNGRLRDRKSVV